MIRSVVVAVALLASTLVGTTLDAGVATAAAPMTVSKQIGLQDGETIDVAITGGDIRQHIVTICTNESADYQAGSFVWYACEVPSGNVVTEIEPGETVTIPFTVKREFFGVDGLRLRCGDAPQDCFIADLQLVNGNIVAIAGIDRVPISFDDAPIGFVEPDVALPPSASVAYDGWAFEHRDVLIRQCRAAWADAPDPATLDGACGAAVETTATDGRVAATVPVRDPLVTVDGTQVPCGLTGCTVVAGYDDEPVAVSRPVAFSQPTLEVSPSTGLVDGQRVSVTVRGMPAGELVRVSFCARGTALRCQFGTLRAITGEDTTWSIDLGPGSWSWNTNQYVSCQVDACSVQVRSDTPGYLNAEVPISYAPYAEVQFDPSHDRLPGEDVAVRGVHLTPGATYQLSQCRAADSRMPEQCDLGPTLVASAAGEVATTIQLTQDPGLRGYCSSTCWVHLKAIDGGDEDVRHPYSWIFPSYSATPRTNLGDGDAVTVTATNLKPEYVGTPAFLPTGGWGVMQCSGSLPFAPTLVQLFTFCGIPEGGGGIPVPGTTASATVRPTASFAAVFGATHRCPTTGALCTLVLGRWEQDGTVSTYRTTISFAP